MPHLLDTPVWSALNSGNKSLAQGTDEVKFYPVDIAPFAGLEANSQDHLRMLYELTAGDEGVFGVVSLEKIEIPKPWTVGFCMSVLQFVFERPGFHPEITASLEDLSDAHIPQMLTLTELTKPGPFRERTIDFGHYQGIFDGEKLVAMAGQRMHAPPYAEISAVCTHPDYTGRGYAAQLMLNQIKRITHANEIPFLHVAKSNERAIKLYESLGFVNRAELFFYLIKK